MRRLPALLAGVRGRLAAATLAGFGTVAAGVGLLATGAYLIVRAGEHPAILELTVAIVGVRFFGISRAVLRYLERLSGHDAALHLVARLRTRAFAAVERLTPAGLEDERAGDLLSRLTDDLEEIEQALLRALLPAAVTGRHRPRRRRRGLGPAPRRRLRRGGRAGGDRRRGGRRGAGRRQAPHAGRLADARADLAASVVDLVEGPPRPPCTAALPTCWRPPPTPMPASPGCPEGPPGPPGLASGLVALGSGLCLWLVARVGLEAAAAGTLDPVLLGALALLAVAAFEPVAALPHGLLRLDDGVAAAARLEALERRPDPAPDPAVPGPQPGRRPPGTRAPPPSATAPAGPGRCAGWTCAWSRAGGWPWSGRAGPGSPAWPRPCCASATSTRGPTWSAGWTPGCCREPRSAASSAWPGRKPSSSPARWPTTSFWAVPRPAAPRCRRALAAARLEAWVASLPAGLATPVGPGGAEVSGGERRRLSLARALLAGFPMLIADEPTAGLDPEAAAAVVAALVATGKDHGLLLITHGAEGLEEMDEIVVLDRGRVAERGTHCRPARRRGPLRPLLGGPPDGDRPAARSQPSRVPSGTGLSGTASTGDEPVGVAHVEEHPLGDLAADTARRQVHHEQRLPPLDLPRDRRAPLQPGHDPAAMIPEVDDQAHQAVRAPGCPRRGGSCRPARRLLSRSATGSPV